MGGFEGDDWRGMDGSKMRGFGYIGGIVEAGRAKVVLLIA